VSLPAAVSSPTRRPDAVRADRARVVLPLLGVAAVASVFTALGAGAAEIPASALASILLEPLGLDLPWTHEAAHAEIVLHLRLPRVIFGFLTGATLAVTGAAMQALFRNPLADPALLGVSSGAGLGAALALVTGLPALLAAGGLLPGLALVPLCAFLGGWLAVQLVLRLGRATGSTRSAHLLLAGLAVNALAGAGTGLCVALADDHALRDITFWLMGSLAGASWQALGVAALPLAATVVLLLRCARPLDALLLGERDAALLGVPVARLSSRLVALVALGTGTAVALSGVIGFVGLLVPHLARLLLGPGHRRLLPACALGGGALLVGADALARSVVAPAELPIGILTTLLGAPLFVVLLRRSARRAETE